MADRDALTPAERTMRRFQHEVRTPLGQIIGYSELLEEELEERGQQELLPDLARIRNAARGLLDLVDGRLREEPEPAPAVQPSGADGSPFEGDAEPDPQAEGARILVVDDELQNRELLARRLGREGFEVTTARDGPDALREIEGGAFDTVMLDVMMPGMNGLEVLERIRRERSMVELPVILATGLTATEDAVEGLGRGANDYVTKPFDFPMVLARLRTQLAVSSAGRQVAALARQLEFRNRFILESLGEDIETETLVALAETPGALDLGGARRTITAVVADVQSARRLAEALEPGPYLAVLRSTLGGLVDVVGHYGGTVDSIRGDSLIATFGLPEPRDDDAARAAACAIALQLEMEPINERNATARLPEVEIAVGIATGPVVVGGFGSGDAMRFKAIGEPFLEASRIEAQGASGEVWICDATRARLGELAELDAHRECDGHDVHRLLGLGGDWLVSLRAGQRDDA